MSFKSKLKKPLNWLKYFCLNFFHNGYAREGVKRSMLNAILGIVFAYLLICGGLTIGYNSSFDTHFKNASQFRQMLASLSDVNLSVNEKRLVSDSVIETLSDDGAHSVNGYDLVIDTRPVDETFDDFTITCVDSSGNKISYEEYAALSQTDQKKYSLTLNYSGKTLDTAEKADIYRAYLDSVCDENGDNYKAGIAESYAKIKEKEASGTLSGVALNNEVYKLYAAAYYPSFEQVERYSSVPTVRTYYIAELSANNSEKFLALFDDCAYCSFYSDSGVLVSFSASYGSDGDVADTEEFIAELFDSTSGMNFIMLGANMIGSLLIFVISMIVVSLLCSRLCKNLPEYTKSSSGLFNIIGGFLFVSGIIAFIFGIALPYGTNLNGAYLAVRLIFLAVVLLRLAVLLVMDFINVKKHPPQPVEENVKAPEVDPFGEMVAKDGPSDGSLVEFGEEDNPVEE